MQPARGPAWPDDKGCGQELWNRLDLEMCRIRLPDMMVLVAGGLERDNAGEFLIYKKVHDVRRDCMPCTHQPAGAFLLTRTAYSCKHSVGRLGVTGGLRRCQVIPAGWLWFPGTKTNSAAVIRYRFPDNLSAAKVFFRIWPHILLEPVSYRYSQPLPSHSHPYLGI